MKTRTAIDIAWEFFNEKSKKELLLSVADQDELEKRISRLPKITEYTGNDKTIYIGRSARRMEADVYETLMGNISRLNDRYRDLKTKYDALSSWNTIRRSGVLKDIKGEESKCCGKCIPGVDECVYDKEEPSLSNDPVADVLYKHYQKSSYKENGTGDINQL